ncbi:hypothetical protein ACHAW6_007112 [Cyclotella cf. meneghiniana]
MEKTIGDSSYKGLPEKVTEKQLGHTSEVFEFLDRTQKWQYFVPLIHHGKNTEAKMALQKMAVKAVVVILEYDMKYHPLFELNLV